MEEILKGSINAGKLEKEGSGALPLLMFLFNRDKIVRNEDIVREYFAAYPAYNITEPKDISDACNLCNPWVIGLRKDRSDQICSTNCHNLERCNYRPYLYDHCENDSILDANCSDAYKVQDKRQEKNASGSRVVKKLTEINCEHAVEFCELEGEVNRYRKTMIDWILKDYH